MIRRAAIAGLLVIGAAAVYAGVAWMPPLARVASLAATGVPTKISHQGVVAVNGIRFNGSGQFRFAVVDQGSGLNLWTNDGTQVGTSNAPAAALPLLVNDGIYNIALGDAGLPNMTAIPPSVFTTNNTAVRIWFDDGVHGVQQLSPDHKLSSSPYAFSASMSGPPGAVQAYAGASAPTGWLLCDGSEVLRTTYADLFAVVGTSFGAGDGSTTFNLPNLRGKVPVGRDAGDPDFGSLAGAGGAKTHTLTVGELPPHQHTVDPPAASTTADGSHNHSIPTSWTSNSSHTHSNETTRVSEGANPPSGDASPKVTGTFAAHSHTVDIAAFSSATTGDGQAHNIVQPYLVLNYIIKY